MVVIQYFFCSITWQSVACSDEHDCPSFLFTLDLMMNHDILPPPSVFK